jgi:arsenate reductase (glutaredoxin)
MITIYHNAKCRKSRSGLEFLKSKGLSPEVIEYIREGISPGEIKELVKMLGITPFELVRVQEEYFKENLKGKNISDEEWFKILSENPRLIRRPVVVNNGKAVLADPPEIAAKLF